MIKFFANHKCLSIFMIFSILFLPITYSDAVQEGFPFYERILCCFLSVLSLSCIGSVFDIALKKEQTKND